MAEYRAVVVGATGAIGRELVKQLTESTRCTSVIALSRRALDPSALAAAFPGATIAKIRVQVVDYDHLQLADVASHGANAAFCCLGTTRKDAGSDEAFRKVDLTYVENSAKLAKEADIQYFALVSASNANARSWFLYPKTKGLAEEAIKALGFRRTCILQPGLLQRGDLTRYVERVGQWILPSVSVTGVAKAMIRDYETNGATAGLRIVSMREMQDLQSDN
ncbi:oxidoreductase htatip2-like protein [Achlya hypogyna]|uniref:Oxidoreductase htatip2-like protein n=1 Tax=Achlya hypogyna TaxID=1202772 RepID=A0A1V9YKB4_ACHHY|nr:oxidoreductase htatip2-like protein [Achlya hypogyna]